MNEAISSVEQLVAAREARGLTTQDICGHLRIANRQLLALEAGDWEVLPGIAFVRAVLRAYGRELQLDVSPLIESLPQATPSNLAPQNMLDEPIADRSMLGFGSGGSGSGVAWLLLLVIALVLLTLFFGGARLKEITSWIAKQGDSVVGGRPSSSSASAPVAPTQRAEQAAQPSSDASPGQASGADIGNPVSAPAVPPPAVSSENAADQQPSAPAPAVANASSPAVQASAQPQGAAAASSALRTDQKSLSQEQASAAVVTSTLRLRFTAQSWIEVRSSDGTVLYTGTETAGSTRDVNISGGASLIIGNAQAVNAELNGEPFDLTAHTRATIARFTLP
ncbi:MAG: helix-turn-helix domain-containing protein [Quisquiliibacterium sp.]